MSERKYYISAMNYKICYKNKHALGFFAVPEYRNTIYMYSEDGVFREFFSGIKLADKSSSDSIWLYIPESNLKIRLGTAESYGLYRSNEVTAAVFACSVKQYAGGKDLIIAEFKQLLERAHSDWVKEQQSTIKEQTAKKQDEQNSLSWLNDILDSRKE